MNGKFFARAALPRGWYYGAMHWQWLIWVGVGYVCGSVPFGLLLGLARGVDIRQHGSGNVGATTTGRVLGRQWGALCLVFDVGKGLVPVLAAGLTLRYAGAASLDPPDAWRWLAVAAAAVLGHVFPVWLKFRGGKGVATGLGAVLGFWPMLTIPGAAAALTWLLLAGMFRYVSLASVLAASAIPVYLLVAAAITDTPLYRIVPFLTVTGLMALLVIIRHRGNLARLVKGAEPKLGEPI